MYNTCIHNLSQHMYLCGLHLISKTHKHMYLYVGYVYILYTSRYTRIQLAREKKAIKTMIKNYEEDVSSKVVFVPHHLAHICSTFLFNKISDQKYKHY